MSDINQTVNNEGINPLLAKAATNPINNLARKGGYTPTINLGGGYAMSEDFPKMNTTLKPGFDPYKYQAQNQGFGEQLVKTVGNSIANFATGLGELVGYSGALITEWGDERDYSNWLTKAMKDAKNPFGEVYRENPELMVDVTDSAWWLNTFGDLATSVATFAVPGAGLARVFGSAFKGAALMMDGARAAKAGMSTARLLKAGDIGARVASAATLAYAEGAMSGLAVYENAYKAEMERQLADGKSQELAHEKAKHIAANAASTTVQLNTILNTGLNAIQMMPFFHKADDAVKKWAGEEARMIKGETAKDYAARMKAFAANSNNAQNYLKSKYRPLGVLGESASESLEELNNQFAEQTGYAQGTEGKDHSMFSQLGELEKYFDRTMNAEGAYAAALGFIGGAGTTAFVDYVPLSRVNAVGEDGKYIPKTASDGGDKIDPKTNKTLYKKQWVNGVTRRYNGQVDHMNSLAEALAKDATWFDQKHTELKSAVLAGNPIEATKVRNQMMDVTNLAAVANGLGENVKEMYNQILETDNTTDVGTKRVAEIDEQIENIQKNRELEPDVIQQQVQALEAERTKAEALVGKTSAMIAGLTDSKENNDYKKLATRANKRIDLMNEAYKEAESDFGYDDSDSQTGVKDYMFRKKAYQKLLAYNIETNQEDLNQLKAQYDKLNPLNVDMDSVMAADTEHAKSQEPLRASARALQVDYDTINVLYKRILAGNATDSDKAQFTSLMQKYGAVTKGSLTKEAEAVRDAIKKEHDRIETQIQGVEDLFKESAGYTEWVKTNPKGTIQEYFDILNNQFGYSTNITQLANAIEQEKTQLAISSKQLKSLETDGYKALRKVMKDDKAAVIAKENAATAEALKNAHGKTLASKINAENQSIDKDKRIKDIDKEIAVKQGELKQVSERLLKVEQDTRGVVDRYLNGQINLKRDLINRIARLNSEIQGLQEKKKNEEEKPTPEAEVIPVDAEFENDESEEAEEVVPEETEEEIIPESTPAEFDAVMIQEQIENWKRDVKGKNMHFTVAELTEMLKAHTLGALTQEQMEEIVIENLVFVREINLTPGELMYELWGNIELLKEETKVALDEMIVKLFEEHEDPRSGVPTDAEIFKKMIEVAPEMENHPNGPYIANKMKQTLEAMQMEVMTIEELITAAAILGQTYRENDQTEEPIIEPMDDVIIMPTDGDNTQPDVNNDSVGSTLNAVHEGKKVLAATNIANTSLVYTEEEYTNTAADGKTQTRYYFNNARDADGNLQVEPNGEVLLDPTQATVGTKIILKVNPAETVFTNGGKIDPKNANAIGTFAIDIFDEAGNKLGNIHTTDWANASRVNAPSENEQFRNVAGDAQAIAQATTDLLGLRMFIAERVNQLGLDVTFETVVTAKGKGTVNLFYENSGPGTPKLLKKGATTKLLPDPNVQFAVVLGGAAKTKWNESVPVSELGMNADMAKVANGHLVAVLPTAAPGVSTFGFIHREPLATDENSLSYKSVIRLFELFLAQESTDETKLIQDTTGHNILDSKGLRALINEQFTETSPFNSVDLAFENNASKRMMLQIGSRNISIGVHGSGESAVSVDLKQTMSEKFKAKILALMQQRLKVVSIPNSKLGTRGINSEGKYFTVSYIPSGEWKIREYNSYNDYQKSITTTSVDGTAKDSKGNYRYTSNPVISFDIPKIAVKAPSNQPIVQRAATPEEDTNIADDLDFFNGDIKYMELPGGAVTSPLINQDSLNIKSLTPEVLTELYNSLPPSERNDRSIADVMKERISLGHTFIAIGENPFRRCS
jgi:hypothetical protein